MTNTTVKKIRHICNNITLSKHVEQSQPRTAKETEKNLDNFKRFKNIFRIL